MKNVDRSARRTWLRHAGIRAGIATAALAALTAVAPASAMAASATAAHPAAVVKTATLAAKTTQAAALKNSCSISVGAPFTTDFNRIVNVTATVTCRKPVLGIKLIVGLIRNGKLVTRQTKRSMRISLAPGRAGNQHAHEEMQLLRKEQWTRGLASPVSAFCWAPRSRRRVMSPGSAANR